MHSAAFSITAEPIDPDEPTVDPRAGAVVEFTGRVRNHQANRRVTALEYEAYEALATHTGSAILSDAVERFGVLSADCVHRVGALTIGDVAIRVRVQSAHRREALQACEHIIDQVKVQVPIWKKEHYDNGDSGWVNCRRCAESASS